MRLRRSRGKDGERGEPSTAPNEPAAEPGDEDGTPVEEAERIIADARVAVDRAMETMHDQILPHTEYSYEAEEGDGHDEAGRSEDGPRGA